MKKGLYAILAALAVFAFVLFGCGGGGTDPDDPNGPDGPSGPGPGGPNAAPGPMVEEILISNGWYTIFKFDLPAGKTVGDYDKLTADYKIADVGTTVRARVFGNYTADDIKFARFMTYQKSEEDEKYNIAVLGSWPGGTSNRWIMNNKYGGGNKVSEYFAASTPGDDEWFTAEYPDVFTSDLFAGWDNTPDASSSLPGRKLTATSTGPLYLGVGLTTAGGVTTAMTYGQKNVVLHGKDGTANVVATPVYFKVGEAWYRAYAGQIDGLDGPDDPPKPNTANAEPGWKVISGDQYTGLTSAGNPALVTFKYDANYPNNDTKPTIADVKRMPGDSYPSLPTPAAPTTGNWTFEGWYAKPQVTDSDFKVDNKTLFYADTTIYARWKEVADGVSITYNNGGGTGAVSSVTIGKGTSLTAAQLGKGTLAGPAGKTTFGGWYNADTRVSTFDYKDYTKLVTTSTVFTADTAIYAYWYNPASTEVTSTGTIAEKITVEGNGGGRIDADGFVIFVIGGTGGTAYLGGGYDGDTLLTFKLPASADNSATSTAKINITYELKDIVPPVISEADVTAGWVKDAAYIWKNGYNKWDNSTTAGNPGSYGNFAAAGGTLTRDLKFFEATGDSKGVAIQINKGDDTSNKQKRAGYVYGIKVTAIAFE